MRIGALDAIYDVADAQDGSQLAPPAVLLDAYDAHFVRVVPVQLTHRLGPVPTSSKGISSAAKTESDRFIGYLLK
jgi:hypothetical protein